jgi:hypothetical protein
MQSELHQIHSPGFIPFSNGLHPRAEAKCHLGLWKRTISLLFTIITSEGIRFINVIAQA